MISQMALERMPTLEIKANEIMEEMCNLNAMDILNLQGLLKAFFANTTRYVAMKSFFSNKIPIKSYNELRSITTQHVTGSPPPKANQRV